TNHDARVCVGAITTRIRWEDQMSRGGILAGSAAAAVIVAGLFVISRGHGARGQAKKEGALGKKKNAAAGPRESHARAAARDRSKLNTLDNLASPPAPKEPRKISGPITGDAKKGAEMVADRNRGGSCLACHVMGPAGGANLPGNVAPDLSEIGNTGREDEWLFNYIYDARVY